MQNKKKEKRKGCMQIMYYGSHRVETNPFYWVEITDTQTKAVDYGILQLHDKLNIILTNNTDYQ